MGNNVALVGEKAYKIKLTTENELGQGTYAAVYKIKRRDTKQVFAAKIFKIPYKDMSSLDEMGYQRELQILKEMKNIFVLQYVEEFIYKEK